MEIRKLETKDFFKAATILGKIGADSFREMKAAVEAEKDQAQVGIAFISSALKYAETDFKNWFADLANVTVEEFDKMGFEAPIEIIEHLAENNNLPLFFQRVKGIVGKFSPSAT